MISDERLEKIAEDDHVQCGDASAIAKELLALRTECESQCGWIECSDRMPEWEVDVQLYCADKKEQMVGYLEKNDESGFFRFATWRNGRGIYCKPTHWRLLAAAPEVE